MIDTSKIDIKQMKIEMAQGDAKRDEGLVEPSDITAIKNIAYGEYGVSNLLDVYYPENTSTSLPTIVNIHGGGYFYGDKELYRFYCMSLAQRGFCVVNFNYRLAPDYLYPAPLEDTNSVIEWMLENQEEFYFDMDSLFLVGDSAGGQLTEQYATIVSNPDYAKLFDFDVPAITFKGVGLNCGVYFLGTEKTPNEEFPFYFNATNADSYKSHFPVEPYITSEFPPASITTASDDFLKVLAQPLKKILEDKKVTSDYHLYANDNQEPLYHVFHIGQKEAISHQCNDEQVAFFKELMKSN